MVEVRSFVDVMESLELEREYPVILRLLREDPEFREEFKRFGIQFEKDLQEKIRRAESRSVAPTIILDDLVPREGGPVH